MQAWKLWFLLEWRDLTRASQPCIKCHVQSACIKACRSDFLWLQFVH